VAMYRIARASLDSAATAGHSACGVMMIALTRPISPSTAPPERQCRALPVFEQSLCGTAALSWQDGPVRLPDETQWHAVSVLLFAGTALPAAVDQENHELAWQGRASARTPWATHGAPKCSSFLSGPPSRPSSSLLPARYRRRHRRNR